MLQINNFYCIEAAAEHIVCKLTEQKWCENALFLMTTSTSRGDFEKPTSTDIHGIYHPLVAQLRDLDSLEGIFRIEPDKGTTVFDFDNTTATVDSLYNNLFDCVPRTDALWAGTGVSVIYNDYATAPTQYPFVIVKSGLMERMRDAVLESLRTARPDEDYTARVTPGVYIEIDEVTGPF